MNHVLKTVGDDPADNDADRSLAPYFTVVIAQFVEGLDPAAR
jgi:hypothetical protein